MNIIFTRTDNKEAREFIKENAEKIFQNVPKEPIIVNREMDKKNTTK